MITFRLRRFVSLLLAVSVALAPLFAAAHMTAGMVGVGGAPHALHADRPAAATLDHSATAVHDAACCSEHHRGVDRCCADCAHGAAVVADLRLLAVPFLAVRAPVVPTLALARLPAVQYHPPQS